MIFVSTRNKNIKARWTEALIQGIGPDGGLFVPEYFPEIENLGDLLGLSYQDLAFKIINLYFGESQEIKEAIDKAYDEKFETKDIAPLVRLEDGHILELFHGPTSAFKDMALSILPHLLKLALKEEGIKEDIVILTATSGDTGKAALEGFAGIEEIEIIVFYPEKGVSQIQKIQMLTQEGDNTHVVGIGGNFDQAQTGVKSIFNDKDFNKDLLENGYRLSSANSINIGRLIPQIVYYFHAYLSLVKSKDIGLGEKINFVVPTGNFGNILAAYYGKKMGLPINKLICASNENNVLYSFFREGTYKKNRDLILTSSPSMDILISSNLERLLYHLIDENRDLVKEKMKDLDTNGLYTFDKNLLGDFYGGFAREEEVKETIRDVYQKEAYLLDPHTAVAYRVYEKYKEESGDRTKTVIVSTASPYKFAYSVGKALDLDIDLDDFGLLESLEGETGLPVPKKIRDLKGKEIRHKNTCQPDKMKEMVKTILRIGDKND